MATNWWLGSGATERDGKASRTPLVVVAVGRSSRPVNRATPSGSTRCQARAPADSTSTAMMVTRGAPLRDRAATKLIWKASTGWRRALTLPEGGSTHPSRVMSERGGLCKTPVAPGFGATRSHQDGVAMANEGELERELAQAQAEIDRLRSENEALSRAEHRAGGHHWLRSTAVVVLFAVGFALVPIAGLAVWSRNTLLDTDRYVETVAPLSDDPNVINSVAGRVTDAIFAQIDVEAELAANLPRS